jgi:hypothetical protein
MVLVRNGELVDQEPWSLSMIPRFFWWIVNNVSFFLQTMFVTPNEPRSNIRGFGYSSGGRGGGGGGDRGNSKHAMGRVGGTGCLTNVPMAGG